MSMYELFILSLRRNRQNPYGTNKKHRKKTQDPVYIRHLTTVLYCFCVFYTIKSIDTAGFYAVGIVFFIFWGGEVLASRKYKMSFSVYIRCGDVSFLPNTRMNGNAPFLARMCARTHSPQNWDYS